MRSSFFLLVILLGCGSYVLEAALLRRHYRRPICEPKQTCSYNFQSISFELCDCPNMQSCPMTAENGIQLKGITYQFCSRQELPTCVGNEVASEVFGIQTSINCLCPADMIYMKSGLDNRGSIQYVCKKKGTCELDEPCGAGTIAGGIRPTCNCFEGMSCVLPSLDNLNLFSTTNATCQYL